MIALEADEDVAVERAGQAFGVAGLARHRLAARVEQRRDLDAGGAREALAAIDEFSGQPMAGVGDGQKAAAIR